MNDEKDYTLKAIFRLDEEIAEARDTVKVTNEALLAEVQDLEAYKALDEARKALRLATEQLRREVQTSAINKVSEQLADERAHLKDLQDILSNHLVQYYVESKDTQVPFGKKARQLLLSARLGKGEVAFQEHMSFPGHDVETTLDGDKLAKMKGEKK